MDQDTQQEARFTQAHGPFPPGDGQYQAMAQAHGGAMEFLRALEQELQATVDAYNASCRSSSIRSQATCRINPGQFMGPINEMGLSPEVPWLTVQDTANGAVIAFAAFTRMNGGGTRAGPGIPTRRHRPEDHGERHHGRSNGAARQDRPENEGADGEIPGGDEAPLKWSGAASSNT